MVGLAMVIVVVRGDPQEELEEYNLHEEIKA